MVHASTKVLAGLRLELAYRIRRIELELFFWQWLHVSVSKVVNRDGAFERRTEKKKGKKETSGRLPPQRSHTIYYGTMPNWTSTDPCIFALSTLCRPSASPFTNQKGGRGPESAAQPACTVATPERHTDQTDLAGKGPVRRVLGPPVPFELDLP